MATAPAEKTIAAQRAAGTPPPSGLPEGAQAAAATLAATGAAAAVALAAAPDEAPQASANAIITAAAVILTAVDLFLAARREEMQDSVDELLADEHPDLPEAERWRLIDVELQAERAYAAAVRKRLDRDLPPALALEPDERGKAVRRILDRERRYQAQREAAIVGRLNGAARKHAVKIASPEGAFWRLSPRVETHTTDCLRMGGRAWPWSVLDVFHPPFCGPWCQCELVPVAAAVRAGWMRHGDIESGDQVASLAHVHEGAVPRWVQEAADDHWRGQPRDPGGQDGGRWVKGGAAGRVLRLATPDERKALKVPPGWTEVHVTDGDPDLLAVGKDAKGRVTRLYSSEHHERQSAVKFARLKGVRDRMPALDKRLAADAPTDDTAAAAALIRRAGLRPGSDRDTKAEKRAFGATNIQAQHVTVDGDTIWLRFTGKKGVHIELDIEDAALARVIAARLDGKSGEDRLFDTDERRVREYVAKHAPGVMPKDLRTLLGTALAESLVAARGEPSSAREAKVWRLDVARQVSAALGNTPSVALASYIAPSVFDAWDRPVPVALAA